MASQVLAPRSGNKGPDNRDEGHYAAFLVRHGLPPVRVELGASEAIDRAIRAWLGAMERGGDREPMGRQLVRAVWEPVAPFAKGAKTILVSPDGA